VPLILVKIEWGKWYKADGNPWLKEGELQADALWDLRQTGNKLSVWHIENDESNLRRVVAGLAGTRDHLQKFDAILLDQQIVTDLKIKLKKTDAECRDSFANDNWHFDLVELTASKIEALAHALRYKGTPKRFQVWEVQELLNNAVRLNYIKFEELKPDIKKKLDPTLASKGTEKR